MKQLNPHEVVYVPVSVNDELPDNNFGVHVLLENGIDVDSYNHYTHEWSITFDRENNKTTHWLKPILNTYLFTHEELLALKRKWTREGFIAGRDILEETDYINNLKIE